MQSERTASDSSVKGERGSAWPLVALLIAAAVVLIAIQMRRPRQASPFIGKRLPALEAAGWLNTDGPLSGEDLRGKVVLVDFWMTTCGPCRRHMPELAELHAQFRDTGLTIVGLTPEAGLAEQDVKRYVKSVEGLDWPIGYGAGFVFDLMGVRVTPTYILFDNSGRSVWSGHSLEGLEEAAVRALAAK